MTDFILVFHIVRSIRGSDFTNEINIKYLCLGNLQNVNNLLITMPIKRSDQITKLY